MAEYTLPPINMEPDSRVLEDHFPVRKDGMVQTFMSTGVTNRHPNPPTARLGSSEPPPGRGRWLRTCSRSRRSLRTHSSRLTGTRVVPTAALVGKHVVCVVILITFSWSCYHVTFAIHIMVCEVMITTLTGNSRIQTLSSDFAGSLSTQVVCAAYHDQQT